MNKPVKNNPGEKNMPQKKRKGKTTDQLMQEHLQNKDHKITGEAIESLDLKLDRPEKITDFTPNLPPKEDKETDASGDKGHITPWNILEG